MQKNLQENLPKKVHVMVKKFGGTSVATIERIQNVAERLKADLAQEGEFPVVVVSAMAGETNRLVALAHQVDPDFRGPAYDMLISSGEQVAVSLLSMALNKIGLVAKPMLGYQVGIRTDNLFSKARITDIQTDSLNSCIQQGIIPVIAGFQGVDEDDNITTLGRGGSDTSAVAIAAALGLDVCEIYTDVPAVFSADPRLVPKAKEIPKISFEEMIEMASLGSKVLQIRSVEIAAKYNVKIHLRSTFEARKGSWILGEGDFMESPSVTSVTHDANTVIIKLLGVPPGVRFLADLFSKLTQKGVSVDIITQSKEGEKQNVAFSVTEEDLILTQHGLTEISVGGHGIRYEVHKGLAKISIIGVGMRNHPGVAAKFFETLRGLDVDVHLVTTSEIKISAVIDLEKLKVVANSLHNAFDLDFSNVSQATQTLSTQNFGGL